MRASVIRPFSKAHRTHVTKNAVFYGGLQPWMRAPAANLGDRMRQLMQTDPHARCFDAPDPRPALSVSPGRSVHGGGADPL